MKKLLTTVLATTIMATSVFGLTACTTDLSDEDAAKISSLQQQVQELTEKLNQKSDADTIAALEDEIDKLTEKLNSAQETLAAATHPVAVESYSKLKYIDKNLSDRDCLNGENFLAVQQYIKDGLLSAGYTESDIEFQEISFNSYVKKDTIAQDLSAVKSYTTNDKSYKMIGRNYVEDENGEYTLATVISENIIVTKNGKVAKNNKHLKQIIVGMHYDGTGTGDNGSGIALGLSTAQSIKKVDTTYTIKFIFFTAEEYGCYGSKFYANSMSDEEVSNTLYMINMDSLICGDYCYLYGGVQNNKEKTVTKTEAYDNAMALAESLGLTFKSNPWTWDNLSPFDDEIPEYASPSTGFWSDHAGFVKKGIPYLYMEATNWEIPDYTGYGESKLTGMIMNTSKDYLDYIETYYPNRPLTHLTKFATLLNALLLQKDWQA